MKKVLLHICCGPCGIYPFQTLTKDNFYVEGLFYNPNIWPLSEYLKRQNAVKNFQEIFKIKVYFTDYNQDLYLERIKSSKDKDSRCRSCFKLRLESAHLFAQDNKFDFFTTTLLVSPYQDQQVIKEIGEEISLDSDTKFLFYDFRPGFREAHKKAKELNLYCQKYCGCYFSLKERQEAIAKEKTVC